MHALHDGAFHPELQLQEPSVLQVPWPEHVEPGAQTEDKNVKEVEKEVKRSKAYIFDMNPEDSSW